MVERKSFCAPLFKNSPKIETISKWREGFHLSFAFRREISIFCENFDERVVLHHGYKSKFSGNAAKKKKEKLTLATTGSIEKKSHEGCWSEWSIWNPKNNHIEHYWLYSLQRWLPNIDSHIEFLAGKQFNRGTLNPSCETHQVWSHG